MKILFLNIFYFTTPLLIIYIICSLWIVPKLIEKTDGPSTESQIKSSFQNAKLRNYDLLILGNSGTYRGINPDLLEIKSYNFSHDNDSYNQMYYKLMWLKKYNKKIKYMIIGVDYFQFSFISETRNYVYSSFFDDAYLKDYPQQNALKMFLSRTNILEFERIKYILNVFKKRKRGVFQKQNGQYIKPGIATKTDKTVYSIKRLPVQKKYFELILNYCLSKKIEVFLIMLPARKNALINYKQKEMKEFNNFIKSYTSDKIHFLNYSLQEGWSLKDYTDITHLNEQAADRFTKQINRKLIYFVKKESPG